MDLLFKRLVGSDEEDRYNAAFQLHKMGRPALERAIELSCSDCALAREMACVVLGRVLDDRCEHQDIVNPTYFTDAIPILMKLVLTDPVPAVKASAAIALSFLSVTEALPILCRWARHGCLRLRFGSALALANYSLRFWQATEVLPHKPSVVNILIHLARDSDAEVRSWAIGALPNMSRYSKRIRQVLAIALTDVDEDVRSEARYAIREFTDTVNSDPSTANAKWSGEFDN